MIKLEEIRLIVYDFDGAMTGNKAIPSEDGFESVIVNRSDCLAVEAIRKMGIRQLILSKENNRIVVKRARKLNIPALHGIDNKKYILSQYCIENSIALENAVYTGNDINDVEVM